MILLLTSARMSWSSPSVGQHFSDLTIVPTSLKNTQAGTVSDLVSLSSESSRLFNELKTQSLVPNIDSLVRFVIKYIKSIWYRFLQLCSGRIGGFRGRFFGFTTRIWWTHVRHFAFSFCCLATKICARDPAMKDWPAKWMRGITIFAQVNFVNSKFVAKVWYVATYTCILWFFCQLMPEDIRSFVFRETFWKNYLRLTNAIFQNTVSIPNPR